MYSSDNVPSHVKTPFDNNTAIFDPEGAFHVFLYIYSRMKVSKLNCSTLMNFPFKKILFPYALKIR